MRSLKLWAALWAIGLAAPATVSAAPAAEPTASVERSPLWVARRKSNEKKTPKRQPAPPATAPSPTAPSAAVADGAEPDPTPGQTASGRRTVLVLRLRAIGVPAGQAATVSDAVADQLATRPSLQVVTSEDVSTLVEHQATLQTLGCDEGSEACLAELSRLANAALALSGSVGAVGDKLVVSLTLVDTETTRAAGNASRSVESAEALLGAVPELLDELFGETAEDAVARYALPAGEEVSFAVFDLKPQGLSAETSGNLTQVLAAELKKIEGASVIGRDDVASLLELEAERQSMDCAESMACLAEIGGALGVDKLVVGTAGKLGEAYVISLRLIDVQAVRVENRIHESLKGLEDQLIPAVRLAGRRLLGLVDRDDVGGLHLTGNEPGAAVFLDEEAVGALPVARVEALVPGRHSLRISKDGFIDWRSDFFVEPGVTTPLWAELVEEPLEWYQRWWVWTIVGVAVATGVGIGVGFYLDGATKFPQTPLGAHPI